MRRGKDILCRPLAHDWIEAGRRSVVGDDRDRNPDGGSRGSQPRAQRLLVTAQPSGEEERSEMGADTRIRRNDRQGLDKSQAEQEKTRDNAVPPSSRWPGVENQTQQQEKLFHKQKKQT